MNRPDGADSYYAGLGHVVDVPEPTDGVRREAASCPRLTGSQPRAREDAQGDAMRADVVRRLPRDCRVALIQGEGVCARRRRRGFEGWGAIYAAALWQQPRRHSRSPTHRTRARRSPPMDIIVGTALRDHALLGSRGSDLEWSTLRSEMVGALVRRLRRGPTRYRSFGRRLCLHLEAAGPAGARGWNTVSSRRRAERIPARRRARATTATRLPRRAGMRKAHNWSASASRGGRRRTETAAWMSSQRARPGPALVMAPRR
jgi:hypothetical protein